MTEVNGPETPIVLLHGGTSSARVWATVVALMDTTHPLIVPNLAGHRGGTPVTYSSGGVVEAIVDDMCRQLDELEIQKAHIVGNSLGGWVALEMARRGRAASVLAISPGGACRSPRDLTRLLTMLRLAGLLLNTAAARRLARYGLGRRLMLAAMAAHADLMTPDQVAIFFEDLAGCVVLPRIIAGLRANGPIDTLEQVDCPVRIAWGSSDRILPFMRYGLPILAAIPSAELTILQDVGHVPMIDDPALTARTIVTFVDAVTAAS